MSKEAKELIELLYADILNATQNKNINTESKYTKIYYKKDVMTDKRIVNEDQFKNLTFNKYMKLSK